MGQEKEKKVKQNNQTCRKLLLFFASGLVATGLSSCHFSDPSNARVIIVAVDDLGVNQVNCAKEPKESHSPLHSGIDLLCQESVRFTHAYTTSPMSAPALTSVLTGQYPLRHGLRHNGKSFLSGRVMTLAEIAHKQGAATALFSGGAPILRKTNLQQGFEVFDDNLPLPSHQFFRPFQKTEKIFESWLKEIGHQSFFSVLYVPDLPFVNTPSQTDFGERRNLTFDSQVEKFDETLYALIQSLRAQKLWDSTTFILVGLNGPETEERADELTNLNLFSERSQVGLLIKPAQHPRDEGLKWSYDGNITLADLGFTIKKVFDDDLNASEDPDLPLFALNSALKSPSAPSPPSRPLLLESDWAEWQEKSTPRYAVRWDQFLFILDQRTHIYNSLIDRFETTGLHNSEPGMKDLSDKVHSLSEKLALGPWTGLSRESYLKWNGLSDLWALDSSGVNKAVSFERLAHRLKDDFAVAQLYSQELINQQSWAELERWAQGMKLNDLEIIAAKNLRHPLKNLQFQNGCLKVLAAKEAQTTGLKQCSDPVALSFLEWIFQEGKESDDSSKEASKKKFLRGYLLQKMDHQIAETNWALQGVWDLSSSLQSVSVIDEMLALPEMQKYRVVALRSVLQAKDEPN